MLDTKGLAVTSQHGTVSDEASSFIPHDTVSYPETPQGD